jgi:uncharacterized coiled-coil protein SlyX
VGDESDELERRLMELEIRSVLQQRTSDQLDEVIREFTLRVERLEKEFRELRRRLEVHEGPTTLPD